MRTLSDSDYVLFEQICKLNQAILWKTMNKFLKNNYKKVVCTKDYIYAEGDIPIALVAHLDTVFPTPPTDIYYDTRKGVLWSPQGLGADDRAGVFSILKIIRSGLKPHVIFTTDEERGGLGAMQLTIMQPVSPFKELKYIIQLDRRGTNDCVFYDCDNETFSAYIQTFGFSEAIGSFSDISEICPVWGIAGVNLSVGYENEHSIGETLHIGPLFDTINKVKNLLRDAKNIDKFNYVPSKYSYYRNWYSSLYDTYYPTEYDVDDYTYMSVVCNTCGKSFSEYEVIPVQCGNGQLKFYCPDCLTMDKVDWCTKCGEAYEKTSPNATPTLCFDCRLEESLKKGKNKSWTSNVLKSSSKQLSNAHKVSSQMSNTYSTSGSAQKAGSWSKTTENQSTNTQKK